MMTRAPTNDHVELDPWELDVAQFVVDHLPDPPGHVIDVGCGRGWLTRWLVGAGYDAIGIDPDAPQGRLFRRVAIDDFDEPGSVDAIVAILSLHHVADVDPALRRISGLLRPGGRLVVVEFAWDRFDDGTAQWCLDRLPTDLDEQNWLHEHCARLRAAAVRGQPLQAATYFREWARGEGFHSSHRMLARLRERFAERSFAWSPYLYPNLDAVTPDLERAAIDAGDIRPVGFRFVGQTLARDDDP